MKTGILTVFAILLASMCLPAELAGAPARPGKRTMKLDNGATITYRAVGDERFHYFVSDDGLPLVNDKGKLYFATSGTDGRMTSSGIEACDKEFRPAATQTFLRGLDGARIITEAAAAAKPTAPSIRPSALSLRSGSRAPESMSTTTFPTTGSPRGLVILAEYSDVKFTTPVAAEYFKDMLNLEGFTQSYGTGSARDYFKANSSGVFTPQFDVYGPVTLPNPQKYYGSNTPWSDRYAYKMIIDACDILKDQGVDFSVYDCDNDGVIDNVYVFYAGYGESSGDPKDADTVWPHSWDIQTAGGVKPYYNGCLLSHYACSNELLSPHFPDGIGTFCHEFSHVLGLPDLYCTANASVYPVTPDTWSVLDVGCYLNDSRTPPHYSSFERMSLGWMKPTEITSGGDYTLPPLAESNMAYLIPTAASNEFFLLENRRAEGWDAFFENQGMLVWHIDYDEKQWYDNTVNNDRNHQYVDLVEAVSRKTYYATPSDPFPGKGNVTEFTYMTTPRFAAWDESDPGFPLTDIRDNGETVSFHVEGDSNSVGIDDITADAQTIAIIGGDAVNITGTDLPATVYSLTGSTVYSGNSRRIELPAGLYIVRIGGKTAKVALR